MRLAALVALLVGAGIGSGVAPAAAAGSTDLSPTVNAPASVAVGVPFAVNAGVLNSGPSGLAAGEATVTIVLPAGVSLSEPLPVGCSGTTSIICAVPAVAGGASTSTPGFNVVASRPAGPRTFDATVDTVVTGQDPVPSNDSDTAVVAIAISTDLSPTVNAPASVAVGVPFAVNAGVLNSGPSGLAAGEAAVTIVLPAGVSLSEPLPVGCSGTTSIICAVPAVAGGASTSTPGFNVVAGGPGSRTFSATVRTSAVGQDPDSSDNTDTADVSVVGSASLPGVVTQTTSWALGDTLGPGGGALTTFSFGARPSVPVVGDWDGDGTKTPGSYEGGTFKLTNTIPPGGIFTVSFGSDPRGFPVAGDFDGDRRDDLAVYRNGTWLIRYTDDGVTSTVTFGAGAWPATVPVAGDWDGDGLDGIGTYTLATGTWSLRQTASNGGTADAGSFVFWTGPGSYPVVGDWEPDGDDTVGVKNGATWSLNFQNDGGAADATFTFGATNDLPVVWAKRDAPP